MFMGTWEGSSYCQGGSEATLRIVLDSVGFVTTRFKQGGSVSFKGNWIANPADGSLKTVNSRVVDGPQGATPPTLFATVAGDRMQVTWDGVCQAALVRR